MVNPQLAVVYQKHSGISHHFNTIAINLPVNKPQQVNKLPNRPV